MFIELNSLQSQWSFEYAQRLTQEPSENLQLTVHDYFSLYSCPLKAVQQHLRPVKTDTIAKPANSGMLLSSQVLTSALTWPHPGMVPTQHHLGCFKEKKFGSHTGQSEEQGTRTCCAMSSSLSFVLPKKDNSTKPENTPFQKVLTTLLHGHSDLDALAWSS